MKYGLKLNKTKCETVYTGTPSNIHFRDGTPVPRTQEAKYLGCSINQEGSMPAELSKRISICMTVVKKLDLFWRHSTCPTPFKLTVLDAVIRAKLLYGMDSAQLNTAQLRKLEVF